MAKRQLTSGRLQNLLYIVESAVFKAEDSGRRFSVVVTENGVPIGFDIPGLVRVEVDPEFAKTVRYDGD